jgi:hypothetical protein
MPRRSESESDTDDDDDDDEEEEAEAVPPPVVPLPRKRRILPSVEVSRLMKGYRVQPPIDSLMSVKDTDKMRYNVVHRQVHLDFWRRDSGGGGGPTSTAATPFGRRNVEWVSSSLIFEKDKREVMIVAVGVNRYSLTGLTSVGLEMQGFLTPIDMYSATDQRQFVHTFLHQSSSARRQLIFKPRDPNEISTLFSRLEEPEMGVQDYKQGGGVVAKYLPIGKGPDGKIICPIGYAEALRCKEMGTDPEAVTRSYNDGRAFFLGMSEYMTKLEAFKDLIQDSRVKVDLKDFRIKAVSNLPNEPFHLSLMLDVFFTPL